MFGTFNRIIEIIRVEGVKAAAVRVIRALRWRVRTARYAPENNIYMALRRGRYAPALGLITEIVTGENVYKSRLRKRYGRYPIVSVNTYEMYIDLDDPGLSNDLIAYGGREIPSTHALAEELRRLKATNEDVTVLEVGANIGYFTLLAGEILGAQADIHAFEPSARNLDLLRKNIELNGFSDRITVIHAAVGSESGEALLELATRANQHFVVSEGVSAGTRESSGVRVPIAQVTLAGYLCANGLTPADIDLIRMDVQGAEYEVFQGAQPLLEDDHDLTIFLETHPHHLGKTKHDELIDWLKAANFEPIHTASNFKTPETFADKRAETIDDLRRGKYEVLLRRRTS